MRTATGAPRRRAPTIALLAFAQLIISIDYNIVYVALPHIGADLGFSAQDLQWVVSAYAVVLGGALLLGGRASDLLGRRRMFVAGLAVYGVASLIGGLATAPAVLLTGRALQGVGGALLFPATLALVYAGSAEGRARNRALSVWAGTGAGGLVVGSLLGGVLTEWLGWQAVFFVNVPLAAVGLVLARSMIPADGPARRDRAFDLPGAVTATAGTTLVVLALVQGPQTGWASVPVLACAVGGTVLVALFVLVESRSSDPLVPLRLFRNRNLAVGVTVTFLFMATFGTLLYFLTVHLQTVLGYSALRTGVALLVPMTAGFVGSIGGGRSATRFGVRSTLVGALAVGGAGTLAVAAAMSPDAPFVALVPGLVVLSLCQGVVFTTMFAAAGTGVSGADQGIAAGLVSTGQQIGSAIGLAVLVAVANAAATPAAGGVGLSAGLRTGVLVIAAGIGVTALVALLLRAPAGRVDAVRRSSGATAAAGPT